MNVKRLLSAMFGALVIVTFIGVVAGAIVIFELWAFDHIPFWAFAAIMGAVVFAMITTGIYTQPDKHEKTDAGE